MALRELLFEIGFKGSASDLIKMDSAVDKAKDNALDATKNIEGMESATNELGQSSKRNGSFIKNNWKQITVATAGLATGIESLTRKNAGANEGLKRLSASTGIESDEMRKLALETSNVTFPMEDVIGLMELGRKQGLKSAEDLQEYAQFWDLIGDATGESAISLSENSNALRSLGIDVGKESEALAAFGYVSENTTQDIGEFLYTLERSAPELKNLDMDINTAAAALGALEDQGVTGRQAQQLFNKALMESDGDMNVFKETLGITSAELDEQIKIVGESSDIMQRNADIHAESYTITQKLGHSVSELAFKYGDTVAMLSDFVPLLTTIGPLMKGFSAISGAMGTITMPGLILGLKGAIASTWAFTTALLANPVTWVVVAIVALIASIWALWKNWDKVTEFISGLLTKFKDMVSNIFTSVVDFISGINLFEIGKNMIQGMIDGMLNMFNKVKDIASNIASSVTDKFKSVFKINSPSKVFMEIGHENINRLDKGMQDGEAQLDSRIDSTSDLMTAPLAGDSNSTSNFSPTLNINVTGDTNGKEAIKNLKAEWEKLMEQYQRRNNLRVEVI